LCEDDIDRSIHLTYESAKCSIKDLCSYLYERAESIIQWMADVMCCKWATARKLYQSILDMLSALLSKVKQDKVEEK